MSAELRAVAPADGEVRLDRWLRRHFPGLGQGAIEKFCRTGQVRVDGRRASPATRLSPGQSVRVPPIAAAPRPARQTVALDPHEQKELRARVLYRDEWLLALDKPAGLAVQGGKGITRHLDAMLDHLLDPARPGAEERLRLVHRLDRETSGVLLLARSAAAAARLAALFRGREVEKTYWALVIGRPEGTAGRIRLALAREGGRSRLAEPGEPLAAAALTEWRLVEAAGRRLAWLELRPLTGRTHQLRVHCAALGTPILGDALYGAAPMEGFGPGLHLHARRLVLPHPQGGRLAVEAGLPPHLRESFHRLGFTAPPPAPARHAQR
ncbi:MAG: RluA family pseudouridine synthase [Acetobacteraceae bacterium]